ncbi:HAMP domain-containing methyl-accepting chemotaxis protein [Rhizobium hainanense]|uniref:Methyl-accepting chemotaxis protein n=1 Tax=Rhizobium hainanense TaxID=52131 RepID=A0A1C3W7U2_9HYPH|nr:methyl-accepting chemotaxis protein [Rhizobium hainanense]SCB36277.1 methyl-accepting chemotaxis protein [Rhizobium hainanense]
MNPFKTFGVAARLVIGFGFTLLLMVGLTVYSVTKVDHINRDLTTINDVNSVKQRYAINFRGSVHDRAIAIRDVALLESEADRKQTIAVIAKLAASYAENEKRMAEMVAAPDAATDQERAILAEIGDIQGKTNPLVAQIIELEDAGNGEQAKKILSEQARPLFVAWLASINKFIDYQEGLNKSIGVDVRGIASGFKSLAFAALGIAILLSMVAVGITARSVVNPLSKLRESLKAMAEGNLEGNRHLEARFDEIGMLARAVATLRDAISAKAEEEAEIETKRAVVERERLAEEAREQNVIAEQTSDAVRQLAGALQALANGDLTQQITVPFIPSLDKVRLDFNAAVEKLRVAMQKVAENASAIAAGAKEIRSASNDLSQRTEQQAASVEETAAALEEITTTVTDSSERAQAAGQLVRQTKVSAQRSGGVVRNAIGAMGKIEASAADIANIVGVIDEIAFQTNLLALNAGVEAARAGEVGKGFAVVAQEVRELAQRSAKAAKEIKELITTSNDHVTNGVILVGETGNALKEIVAQVEEVDGNVTAIVQSSKEQALSLKEINTAVNTIDQGTQQNAAMVEQATAAAYSLAQEADALFHLLRQFDTGADLAATRKLPTPSITSIPRSATPVRRMAAKVVQSFGGNVALASDWEEF